MSQQPDKMPVSVIISTFNQPRWLEKVLHGYACQKDAEFEIVIAEDGQDDATAQVVDRARGRMGPVVWNLVHVRHRHAGFRKCVILNRAVLAASGDYLIFTDGDCVPHPRLVATHTRLARPGRFLSGGYLKIGRQPSLAMGLDQITSGLCFDPRWLAGCGQRWSKWFVRLRLANTRWAAVLDRLTTTRPTWNGCNSSTFKEYLLRVNGFDNRLSWGGEDREFGERLENAGIKGVQIRHRAICLHLDHDRSYVTPEGVAFNSSIRRQIALEKGVKTPFGIDQLHLEPG